MALSGTTVSEAIPSEVVQVPEEFVHTADWTDWQSGSAVDVFARVRGAVPPVEP